jgi:hypothetical protein
VYEWTIAVAIKRYLQKQLIDAPTQESGMVERIYLPGHSFEVGNVLFRDLNGAVWDLASLLNLARFDIWTVTAVGQDWFEVPRARGNITVPKHGWGITGELLFLDWRVNGKLTLDLPAAGELRSYNCSVVDENTINWDPEMYYEYA